MNVATPPADREEIRRAFDEALEQRQLRRCLAILRQHRLPNRAGVRLVWAAEAMRDPQVLVEAAAIVEPRLFDAGGDFSPALRDAVDRARAGDRLVERPVVAPEAEQADSAPPGAAPESGPRQSRLDAIEEDCRRQDWASARRRLDSHLRLSRPNWRLVAMASAKLEDWAGVLLAEKELVGPEGLLANLPASVLPAALRARLALGRLEDAETLLRQLEGSTEDGWKVRRWRVALARAIGGPEAAATEAARAFRAGIRGAFPPLVDNLIALKRHDDCRQALESAERNWIWRKRAPLDQGWAAYHLATGDHEAAGSVAASLEGEVSRPGHLLLRARVAAAARRTGELTALVRLAEEWAESADDLPDALAAGPALAAHHYRCLANWTLVQGLVDRLSPRILAPRQAGVLANVLRHHGDYGRARQVIWRSLGVARTSPTLWVALLAGHAIDGGGDEVDEVRRHMEAALGREQYLLTLSRADPRLWPGDDVPAMVRHHAADPGAPAAVHFFSSLRRFRLDLEHLPPELVEPNPAVPPPLFASFQMIVAQATDARALEDATLRPASVADFAATRERAMARIDAALDRCREPASGSVEGIGGYLPTYLRHLDAVRDRYPRNLLHTAESFADSLSLARLIVDHMERRAPLSVLRLGDGEGNFLPYADALAGEREADLNDVMSIWWGPARPEPETLARIEHEHLEAVDRADVVGVIPPWRLTQVPRQNRPLSRAERGVRNSVDHAANRLRSDAVITSAHLHHDLHHWNLWREVLGRAQTASFISCHDLSGYLWNTHGVRARQAILIPAEHRYAAEMGAAGSDDDRPLIERHGEVLAAIDARPGEPYLVAAGFLGKIYCDAIRSQGGVAIDIGSVADYWMGFTTRNYRDDQGLRLSLASTLIRDHGLPPDDPARIVGRQDAPFSTVQGRFNIADDESTAKRADEPRLRRRLRVIGHPRCASGYMATLFSAHGLEIGHERLLEGGVSSWMYVVSDARLPYGDSLAHVTDFDLTVVHVRDPREAIPSIMLENAVEASFDFRRQHILRERGVDIAAYGAAIDRAVASFVHWYAMALDQAPDAVIRAEDAEREVPAFLRSIGVEVVEPEGPVANPAESGDADGDDEPEEADEGDEEGVRYNASARKFARSKPEPTAADYAALAPELRDALAAFCARFGYESPFVGPAFSRSACQRTWSGMKLLMK